MIKIFCCNCNSFQSSETQVIKDIQGTQEITVTRRVGNKKYTCVKKRDKDGKEEIVETMINMNDGDKSFINSFFKETFFSKYFKQNVIIDKLYLLLECIFPKVKNANIFLPTFLLF